MMNDAPYPAKQKVSPIRMLSDADGRSAPIIETRRPATGPEMTAKSTVF